MIKKSFFEKLGIIKLSDISPRFSLTPISATTIYDILLDTTQEKDLLLLEQEQTLF